MDQALMVIRDSGLKDHHGKDVDGKGEGRVENLDELVNAASLFVNEEEGLDDLTAFLSRAALEAGASTARRARLWPRASSRKSRPNI